MSYLLKNEKRHKNPLRCALLHNAGDFSSKSHGKKWSSSRQEVPTCHHLRRRSQIPKPQHLRLPDGIHPSVLSRELRYPVKGGPLMHFGEKRHGRGSESEDTTVIHKKRMTLIASLALLH